MKMSLQNSSRKQIRYVLLTGKPGIGKSTLVKKICTELVKKGIDVRGFYTEEIRQEIGRQRIGFDVVTLSGHRAPLARVLSGTGREPRVGKYSVCVKSFEDIVMPVFLDASSDNSILVIDEIGKMEMYSEPFCKEVRRTFTTTQTILATIPLAGNSFVKGLKSLPTAHTFELDYSNRNALLDPVVEILLKSVKTN